MSSQLNVDTIVDKAGSGGTNVKVKGSNSTYIDGTTTQNLVDSLAKSYVAYQTTNPTGVISSQSFNHSSLTDVGTGTTKLYVTNPRSLAKCPSSHSGGDGSAGYSAWMREEEITTTQYGTGTGNGDFSSQDGDYHCVLTYGDLA